MQKLRVLSFDPRIGYAIVDYHYKKEAFNVVTFGTLNKDKFEPPYKEQVKTFGAQLVYLALTESHVKYMMDLYEPDQVVSEDAFSHKRFIATYRILSVWISTISLLLFKKYKMLLHLISPLLIKKLVAGTGNADKDKMKEALLNYPKLSFNKDLILEDLTEHSIDAICCGIAHILMINNNK